MFINRLVFAAHSIIPVGYHCYHSYMQGYWNFPLLVYLI